jgi:hypothetical protein
LLTGLKTPLESCYGILPVLPKFPINAKLYQVLYGDLTREWQFLNRIEKLLLPDKDGDATEKD